MIDNTIGFIDLGCGIRLRAGEIAELPPEVHVFMDRLLLPCRIADLTVDQIAIVNRFRESFSPDDELGRRAYGSRAMFKTLVDSIRPQFLLELGCGKFPTIPLDDNCFYRGVEIDDEASNELRSRGLTVHDLVSFEQLSRGEYFERFDLLIGSFSFHFNLDLATLSSLGRTLHPERGMLVFNFIAEDGFDILKKMHFFCALGLDLRILKGENFSRREFLVVAAKSQSMLHHPAFNAI